MLILCNVRLFTLWFCSLCGRAGGASEATEKKTGSRRGGKHARHVVCFMCFPFPVCFLGIEHTYLPLFVCLCKGWSAAWRLSSWCWSRVWGGRIRLTTFAHAGSETQENGKACGCGIVGERWRWWSCIWHRRLSSRWWSLSSPSVVRILRLDSRLSGTVLWRRISSFSRINSITHWVVHKLYFLLKSYVLVSELRNYCSVISMPGKLTSALPSGTQATATYMSPWALAVTYPCRGHMCTVVHWCTQLLGSWLELSVFSWWWPTQAWSYLLYFVLGSTYSSVISLITRCDDSSKVPWIMAGFLESAVNQDSEDNKNTA